MMSLSNGVRRLMDLMRTQSKCLMILTERTMKVQSNLKLQVIILCKLNRRIFNSS